MNECYRVEGKNTVRPKNTLYNEVKLRKAEMYNFDATSNISFLAYLNKRLYLFIKKIEKLDIAYQYLIL